MGGAWRDCPLTRHPLAWEEVSPPRRYTSRGSKRFVSRYEYSLIHGSGLPANRGALIVESVMSRKRSRICSSCSPEACHELHSVDVQVAGLNVDPTPVG